MKALLIALALFSLCFAAADWQAPAMLAVFSAFMVLIILYMMGRFVDSSEMQAIATEELQQVLISVFFLALIVGMQQYSSSVFSPILASTFGNEDGGDHLSYALEYSESVRSGLWDMFAELTTQLAKAWGSMSSLSATCSILGSSLSYSGCGGIQIPFSSVVFAENAMSTAILAVNSQHMLLKLAQTFFFPVLLPLGIFLRCFHFTRGAGGLLMAVAFSFYFILPISILLTGGMLNSAEASAEISEPTYPYPPLEYVSEDFGENAGSFEVNSECNPMDLDQRAASKQAKYILGDYGDEHTTDPLLFYFFIGGLFTVMLNILITLSAVRALSALFGSEVDLSSLARIS